VKTLSLKELALFLDTELGLAEFPGDESVNGLQVEGREEIRSVGLAVDACDSVFDKAAGLHADLLIVHHGLIWGGIKSIRGLLKKRIKKLLDAGISLYACHLPLDWHPEYGNNIQLLKTLAIEKKGEFGAYHGKRIGYWGKTGAAMSMDAFVKRVDKTLKTRSSCVDFGRRVRNVAVVSGGGWSAIHDAEKYDIDTFLTGEPSHSAYTIAEELRVNLVFAGHYATETLGVKAVGGLLKKRFGLTARFIDHPTGL
jgi:dinuclear metal center YbgI/SA1388 family protein